MKGRPGEISQLSCAGETWVLEGWAWRVTGVVCASLLKSLVIASCLCPIDGFKLSRTEGRAIASVLLNRCGAWEVWCVRWNIQFIGRCFCLWLWVFWITPYQAHITCWFCVWKVLLYQSYSTSPPPPTHVLFTSKEVKSLNLHVAQFSSGSCLEKSSCFSFKHVAPRFWGVTVLWRWILLCQYKGSASINDMVFMGLSNLT